jgi:hypothetical protein
MKVDWHSYSLTLSTLIDENYKSTQNRSTAGF